MNDIIFFYWRTFILFHFVLFILYKVVVKFVQSKRELIYKIFIQDIIFFSSFMKINSTKNHLPNRITSEIYFWQWFI